MKKGNNIDLSVLIVNWNGGDVFKKCLKSIKREVLREKIKYEIIIVDNNSNKNEIEYLSKLNNKNIIVINNKENLKFAKATNQSVAQSRGKLLLILNNDIILQKNSLKFLLEKIKNNDAVVPQLVYPNGTIQKSITGLPKIKDIFYISIGLNMLNKKYDKWMLNNFDYQKEQLIFDQPYFSAVLIKKNTWNKVGKLDEKFPLLWNDTDWFFRFQELKLKCLYIPKAKVTHIHGMSVNKHRFNKIKESTISMKKYFIKNNKIKIYDRIFLEIICVFTFILRVIREVFLLIIIKIKNENY